jgi:cobalt/nickel transport system permease protein
VGLTALIFAVSFVRDLRLLPLVIGVALGLYAVSRMPLSFLVKRLRTPGFFLLAMALLLPLLSGSTVVLQVGPLALRQEGCLESLRVVTKFTAILTLSLVLFGAAPLLSTIKAMRSLGLPPILADMTLLSYRYIYEVGGDLARMERAMQLRGFRALRPDGRTLGNLAALAGSLLVRSYERSERVYKAMVLRGYGRSTLPPDEMEYNASDKLLLGGTLLLAAALVIIEMILRGRGGGLL